MGEISCPFIFINMTEWEELIKKASLAADVIKEYFGEDKVDFQQEYARVKWENDPTVPPRIDTIVYFPTVTVTNENNNSTRVDELYVKFSMYAGGKIDGGLSMLRSKYTTSEWFSDYCHSHCNWSHTYFDRWAGCCLGRGPIQDTIFNLSNNFDLDRWGLFCFELDKYVTVESLAGVPYRRLETICEKSRNKSRPEFSQKGLSWVPEFLKYAVKNVPMKFSFSNGKFTLGEPYLDFRLKMTEAAKRWVEHDVGKLYMDLNSYMTKIIVDGIFDYTKSEVNMHNNMPANGVIVLTFKGKPVPLLVTGRMNTDNAETEVLIKEATDDILTQIIKVLNYEYTNAI